MDSHKNDDIDVCPHCGAENSENIGVSEAWLSGINDREPVQCFKCKKALHDDRNSDCPDSEKMTDRSFNIRFFIITVVLLGLLVYMNWTFEVFTFSRDSGQIIYEILVILIVSSALASGEIRRNLKYLAIWGGIFLILMVGYSYRHQLSGVKDKVMAELIPAKGFQKNQNSVSFPVSSDGHFYIWAKVSGIPVMFLADTGASHIVLSPKDAGKLGIETDQLRFDRIYETANGNVRGSSIRISDFSIGELYLKDIRASVNEAEMRHSLLGMTFFKRLMSYQVKNDVLTLHWSE